MTLDASAADGAPVTVKDNNDNSAKGTGMQPAVIIVGSGFAGIGLAIRLRQAGFDDITILEKGTEVGGVWRDNTYPGAACDVPSHLYCYSFERHYAWRRKFASQHEIKAYIEFCARKYDVMRHIRFNAEVASAQFDRAASQWQVTLVDGSTLRAPFLVTGVGQLNRPAYPDIAGLHSFSGKLFHSAAWDHSFDFRGKRVAVIGTGASAIQFIPPLAQTATQVVVLQRNPPYIIPRHDRAYSPRELAWLEKLPLLRDLSRLRTYLLYETRVLGFTWLQPAMVLFRLLWWWHLCRAIKDKSLREKLTPSYRMGCKRILLSDDYYPALAQPNVSVDTRPIAAVEPAGVRMRDGTLHRVDAIVLGTGFHATDFLAPMRISGRDGVDLDTVWQHGAYAHLGVTVPGFPNLFLLYGPNTNLGHNSIVYMLESQIAYVVDAIGYCAKHGLRALEIDATLCRRYNDEIQRRLQKSVWSSGCSSWYVTDTGRQTVNWPGFTFEYRHRLAFDPAAFHATS